MSANDTTVESSKAIGDLAEGLAARFLEQQGLKVLTRNFRCRGGEIDLICRDGSSLVFVEVRQRSRADFGGAGASITAAKRRRIVLAASHYLQRFAAPPPCRFDVVVIEAPPAVQWLRAAFDADG